MKSQTTTVITLIALATLVVCASKAPAQSPSTRTRVGTYDSRAVALAYYNSEEYRARMGAIKAEVEAAKVAGDEKKHAELRAQMPFLQARMHWQVFSSVSAPNVIATIADALPSVASKARVAAIVSKWELVFRDESIEYVDLTPELVALFKPTEQVQKWVTEMAKKDPIPLDSLPPESGY